MKENGLPKNNASPTSGSAAMPVPGQLGAELDSHGCYNKWAQNWWLKTTKIHFPTVPEAGSLKSVPLEYILSRGCRGKSDPCPFPAPAACSIPWLVVASLQLPRPAPSHLVYLHITFFAVSGSNGPLPLSEWDLCDYI